MILVASLAVGSLLNFDLIGNRGLKPVHDLVNWFDKTFDAKGDNNELAAKVQAVRRQAVAGQVARAENAELRSLVRFDNSGALPPGLLVTGRVIVRSLEDPYSFLEIDRGAADCVTTGDVVFNGYGLVGKVDRVSQHTARVRLVTNPTSAVSAKGEPSGFRGLVVPDARGSGSLILKFINQTRSLHAGQEILTSDWHSREFPSGFPANIPIGRISKVSLSRLDATGSVPIKLYADLDNLELVQILTGGC